MQCFLAVFSLFAASPTMTPLPTILFFCIAAFLTMSTVQARDYPRLENGRVDIKALMANLTLEQKVGQMLQLDINIFLKGFDNAQDISTIDPSKLESLLQSTNFGSILNSPYAAAYPFGSGLNVSQWQDIITTVQKAATSSGSQIPVLFGIDSIHGATYVYGATLFPQQINLAATFNPDLVEQVGAISAKDTRTAGLPWSFSPVLGIATQPSWPRVFETFGEDPFLASTMATAIINGYQGSPANISAENKVAACFKHFIGYSSPVDGHDVSPTPIPDRALHEYYVPSFQAAIDAGAATGMESYTEIDGVPNVASKKILRDVS